MGHSFPLKPLLIAASSMLVLHAVCADDIPTLSGRHYRNVTVTRVEPDGITVTTRNGVKKLHFSELAAEVRARYGYDAAREAAYKTGVQRADEIRAQTNAAKLASLQLIHGVIVENTTQGVLMRCKVDSGRTVRESGWRGDKRVSVDVPLLVDAFYLIKQHPNADVLKPGTPITITAMPGGREVVEGRVADVYTFVRDNTPVK